MKLNPAVFMKAVLAQIEQRQDSEKAFAGMQSGIPSFSEGSRVSPRRETRKSIREARNRKQHKLGRRNRRH